MGCEATLEGGPADTHRSLVPRQRLQRLRGKKKAAPCQGDGQKIVEAFETNVP